MSDVLEILDASRPQDDDTPMPLKRGPKPKPPKPVGIQRRKPEGMHRELFALLNTSDSDTPLLPTDFDTPTTCYKQAKANLGIKRPRKWLWTPFLNPARKDHLQLYHWRRVTDPNEPPNEYQFAKYNSKIDSHVPKFNEDEHKRFLQCKEWTKEEDDYLMEMCTRFDLRFIVIHDRWDTKRFPKPPEEQRRVEDLKERYYFIYNQLAKARAFMEQPKLKVYDSNHERKRKQQLVNLYNRTKEQVEEEANLINELKKIEQKKRERERKTQDLQKIMDAAGRSAPENKRSSEGGHHSHHHHTPTVGRPSGSGARGMPGRRPGRGAGRPSRDSIAAAAQTPHLSGTAASLLEANTVGIKFPDFKTSGTSLRSQRLKLPTSLGTKKMKALEQMIQELGLDQFPMPTESICQNFNELRSDLLLLYEIKVNLANTDFEIQSIKNQLAVVKPELIPVEEPEVGCDQAACATTSTPDTSSRDISDVIDINAVNTPGRKRKAALEQSNVLRKLKKTL